MKKKLFAIITLTALMVSLLSGCGNKVDPKVKEALDGKKVLFVGCSFTYYGGCVTPADENNHGRELEPRMNDNGFFYQLCKANGIEVNVVDWTFGGHNLKNLLGSDPCTARQPCMGMTPNGHVAFLTDRAYDYVILNEINRGKDSAEEIYESVKGYAQIFKDANPDVKIYYIVHDGVYASKYGTEWLKSVSLIEKEGIEILDWGTLVWDVATGKTEVPGATLSYDKNSFIVSKDPSDGYHPNILTGYLFALMTFSAITGTDAVGQPYDFCYSKENENYPISVRFLTDYFKDTYYKWDNKETPDVNERKTNFIEIFNSEADMKGLQSLVNTYLADDTNAWEKYITQ